MKNKLFTLFLFLSSFSAHGQIFRWATGGGSNCAIDIYTEFYETTRYMCSDSHGNIYALSVVGDLDIRADTFYRAAAHNTGSAGSIGSDINFLLTSYRCDGTMRWARLLEDNAEGLTSGLTYDGRGNIYVSATSDGTAKYIADSLVDTSTHFAYVARFDTSGDFKWVRYVGKPDGYDYGTGSGNAALNTDDNDNIHYTIWIKSNVTLTPTLKTTQGNYDLVYDSLGNLLNISRLQLPDSNWYVANAAINKQSGTIYGKFEDDNDNVDTTYQMVAAYDNTGKQLWTDSLASTSGLNGIIYSSGYIYSAGGGEGKFIIKQDSVLNIDYGHDLDIIVKLDTNGNTKWIYRDESSLDVDALLAITQLPNGNLAAAGLRAGITVHGRDTLQNALGTGQLPFLNIVDTAGNFVSMAQALGDGFYNWGMAIAADTANNVYMGGTVEDSIYVPYISGYHSNGGTSDFFIMKYGLDCNCTSAPVASFTYSGTSDISFTFTGTTPAAIINWDFGDSTTGTGLTADHKYHRGGTYNVCATVYTGCGTSTYCQAVDVPEDVSNMGPMAGVSVYPNPMVSELTISHAVAGTIVKLYDVVGRQVYSGIVTSSAYIINTATLDAGNYVLKLTAPGGSTGAMLLTK